MKLSEQEKAAHRAAFRNMGLAQKADHIFTYYKWRILLGLAALIILGSAITRQLTQKETLVSLALVNVSVGESLEADLTDGFLRHAGANVRRNEVYLYKDLYLSDDADILNHEYAYASRMKMMGAVSAAKLDLVLMNREAYDLLSRSGYLLELSEDLFADAPGTWESFAPFLQSNDVILSDNSIEYQLGEADQQIVDVKTAVNAIDVTDLPLFAKAGFPESVYLGVIANTSRLPGCLRYIGFLLTD